MSCDAPPGFSSHTVIGSISPMAGICWDSVNVKMNVPAAPLGSATADAPVWLTAAAAGALNTKLGRLPGSMLRTKPAMLGVCTLPPAACRLPMSKGGSDDCVKLAWKMPAGASAPPSALPRLMLGWADPDAYVMTPTSYRASRRWGKMAQMEKQAACVLLCDGQNILAVSRGPTRLDWGLPGGKVEPGETVEEGARRELWEETGYVIDDALFAAFSMQSGEFMCTTFFPGADCQRFFQVQRDTSRFEGFVNWVRPEILLSATCTFAEYNKALFEKMGIL